MTDHSKDIARVIESMDHNDDAAWTSDGLPKTEYVQGILGLSKVTREEISKAAPNYSRMTGEQRQELAKQMRDAEKPKDTVDNPAVAQNFGPRVTPVRVVPTIEEIRDAEQVKLSLDKLITEADGELAAARDKREALNVRRDVVIRFLEGTSQVAHADTVRAYLNQQVKQAHENKAKQQAAAAALGIPIAASKLDASMQRRTGYGLGRKAFPSMAG